MKRADYLILGVAFDWGIKKGLDVFCYLADHLSSRYRIVLVGTNDSIDKLLPDSIISIHRTNNQMELARIYSAADVFVNPTREDNFPTVNIEALACGTPVITFNTGGSAEMIDETCGYSIPVNDYEALIEAIIRTCEKKPFSKNACVNKVKLLEKTRMFTEYIALYSGSQK